MKGILRKSYYVLYYAVGIHLPDSYNRFFGRICMNIRAFLVRNFIVYAGSNINICKGAILSKDLTIGKNSGIGKNSVINGPTEIGENVMMGQDVMIFTSNHNTERVDIPMCLQGNTKVEKVILGDDVWIGARAIILPNITVGKGSIIAAGSVVTKNIPPYTVVGGNPAKFINKRSGDCSNV